MNSCFYQHEVRLMICWLAGAPAKNVIRFASGQGALSSDSECSAERLGAFAGNQKALI